MTGTYQWDATYGGDANNRTVSENNATSEQVAVSPASPSIATTPSATSVTLGTSTVTLKDTAVLSGGYYPTGTIVFTLYQGGTLVDTETATVNGNGSYATPVGYTLATTGTVTGTYQWDATYTDSVGNNLRASDNNDSREQVTVSPASPTIATTPSATSIALGTTTVTLKDTAVLSGGYYPGGSITFTLVAPGSATVDTETATVSGNGSYSTPIGYTLPTNGHGDRHVPVGCHLQRRLEQQDGQREQRDQRAGDREPGQPVDRDHAQRHRVTLGTSTVTLKDTAVLSGGYYRPARSLHALPGQHLSIRRRRQSAATASYTTPAGYTLPTTGTVTGPISGMPATAASRTTTRPARTTPLASSDGGSPASPADHHHARFTSVALGSTTPAPLTDTAVLSGGYFPTGWPAITFTLTYNSASVYTDHDGQRRRHVQYCDGRSRRRLHLPTTGTVTGTYQWVAVYGGDGNNVTATDQGGNEPSRWPQPGQPNDHHHPRRHGRAR